MDQDNVKNITMDFECIFAGETHVPVSFNSRKYEITIHALDKKNSGSGWKDVFWIN